MKAIIKDVRLAFPHIFEAKVNEGGKAQFGAAFIFTPAGKAKLELDKVIEDVGFAKWGQKWAAVKKQLIAGDNLLIHNGDAKASLAGYEGNLYLNGYNYVRPTVVDRDRTPLTQADGKPYSGCYVNAILDIWAQDNQYGKRINAQLQGIQFVKDGEAFAGGSKVAVETDFDTIEDGADAEDIV